MKLYVHEFGSCFLFSFGVYTCVRFIFESSLCTDLQDLPPPRKHIVVNCQYFGRDEAKTRSKNAHQQLTFTVQ